MSNQAMHQYEAQATEASFYNTGYGNSTSASDLPGMSVTDNTTTDFDYSLFLEGYLDPSDESWVLQESGLEVASATVNADQPTAGTHVPTVQPAFDQRGQYTDPAWSIFPDFCISSGDTRTESVNQEVEAGYAFNPIIVPDRQDMNTDSGAEMGAFTSAPSTEPRAVPDSFGSVLPEPIANTEYASDQGMLSPASFGPLKAVQPYPSPDAVSPDPALLAIANNIPEPTQHTPSSSRQYTTLDMLGRGEISIPIGADFCSLDAAQQTALMSRLFKDAMVFGGDLAIATLIKKVKDELKEKGTVFGIAVPIPVTGDTTEKREKERAKTIARYKKQINQKTKSGSWSASSAIQQKFKNKHQQLAKNNPGAVIKHSWGLFYNQNHANTASTGRGYATGTGSVLDPCSQPGSRLSARPWPGSRMAKPVPSAMARDSVMGNPEGLDS